MDRFQGSRSLFEFWTRFDWGKRLRFLVSRIAERSPIIITIQRRPPATPLPPGERGLWDFLRDSERAMTQMNLILGEMTRSMQKAGQRAERYGGRMNRAAARHYDVERAYPIGERSAKAIREHAAHMESLEVRLRQEREQVIRDRTAWLRGQPPGTDVSTHLAGLRVMGEAAAGARTATQQYRESVRGLRQQNASQPINQATDYLDAVLTRVIENMEATERFCRNPTGGGASRRRGSSPRR